MVTKGIPLAAANCAIVPNRITSNPFLLFLPIGIGLNTQLLFIDLFCAKTNDTRDVINKKNNRLLPKEE